jgi:hypothetical protein
MSAEQEHAKEERRLRAINEELVEALTELVTAVAASPIPTTKRLLDAAEKGCVVALKARGES